MPDIQGIVQNIVISRDKSIYVPEIIKKSIVQRDHNVDRLTFDCPRYWNGIDISKLNIYVNYIAEGQKKKKEDPGSFLCENVIVDEDNTDIFHFDWRITSNASEFPDKLIFLVCAKSVDAEGNENVHWNSHLCKEMEVQEGLEASSAIVKRYPDVIESILSKLGKQIELRNSGTAIQYRNAGENTWVDLVQLEDIKGDAAVIIESNFKGSDTTANIIAKTGETGDKWYSTDEGVYYMINSFGDWINCGSGENLKKIEDEIDALKGDISQLSEEIGKQTGTGLSTEAIDKLEDVGNYLAYTTADGGSKWTELISILRNGSSGGGSSETEVTLSSISATYTGGEVATGTELTSLTGIIVTATYSDGTAKTVTGYTLSGEILEGENTITVSYGGKTTTFTVTGIVESGGGEATAELPADGLVSYFDFRTCEYNNAGSGGSTLIQPTQGNGQLFTWANNMVTEQNDYGMKVSRSFMFDENGGTTKSECGESFTWVFKCYLTVVSSPMFTSDYCSGSNTRKIVYKPKYNTASSTAQVAGEGLGVRLVDAYDLLILVVDKNICKLYFGNELIKEIDGNTIEGFVSWYSKLAFSIIGGNNAGYFSQLAIYNKALSDVEITEMKAYLETLEVA